MTWAKFDDGIYDHPKVIQAGRDARELFFASVVYSSRHLTDGMIPRGALRILQAWTEIEDAEASAARLIAVGLWESNGADFLIHDFLVYQPPAEEVKAKREARAEAGRKGGLRSGQVRADRAAERSHNEVGREANEAKREAIASGFVEANEAKREANAKQNRTPYPYPSNNHLSSKKVISSLAADVSDEASARADAQEFTAADAVVRSGDRAQQSTPSEQTERPAAPAHPSASSGSGSARRPVNPLWDALVEIFGIEPRTPQERSKWGKVIKDLKAANATADELRLCKRHYDEAVALDVIHWNLTPTSFPSHFVELLASPRASPLEAARASRLSATTGHRARNGGNFHGTTATGSNGANRGRGGAATSAQFIDDIIEHPEQYSKSDVARARAKRAELDTQATAHARLGESAPAH